MLFLVQVIGGSVVGVGGGSLIDLSSLNEFVTLSKFNMETMVSVLELIRKGDVMSSINLKDAYFQILIQPDSPDRTPRKGLSIQGSLLWPFFSSPSLHQGVHPSIKMGSSERDSPPSLSR